MATVTAGSGRKRAPRELPLTDDHAFKVLAINRE